MNLELYLQIGIPIGTLILGFILNKLNEDRPKLIHYYVNPAATNFSPPNEEQKFVNTHTLIILNRGRKTANNIKLGHHILPSFSIYPSCDYKIIDLPDGKKEIIIPKIVKKEQYIINYLYFPPITIDNVSSYIKSDEGYSKVKTIQYTPMISKPLQIIATIMLLLGCVTTLYFFIKIIINIVNNV